VHYTNPTHSHPKTSSNWQFWPCFNIWGFRLWRDPRTSYDWR